MDAVLQQTGRMLVEYPVECGILCAVSAVLVLLVAWLIR